jgi:hypothetical protein
MSKKVFEVSDLAFVVDRQNEAIFVTFDIENRKSTNGFGGWIVSLHSDEVSPVRGFYFFGEISNYFNCIRVLASGLNKLSDRDKVHRSFLEVLVLV